ncbi:hypothetical protein [Photorhabdus sp. CRCIA-P01]|uniref:hypothetical protein n=1 Tax=Photorhabdus sp. CRCIA-P01 TaxID=2019570 RepID=UPI000E599C63|nr:hypothetical protein [Photorhabdus sp. CRCIA-P01]
MNIRSIVSLLLLSISILTAGEVSGAFVKFGEGNDSDLRNCTTKDKDIKSTCQFDVGQEIKDNLWVYTSNWQIEENEYVTLYRHDLDNNNVLVMGVLGTLHGNNKFCNKNLQQFNSGFIDDPQGTADRFSGHNPPVSFKFNQTGKYLIRFCHQGVDARSFSNLQDMLQAIFNNMRENFHPTPTYDNDRICENNSNKYDYYFEIKPRSVSKLSFNAIDTTSDRPVSRTNDNTYYPLYTTKSLRITPAILNETAQFNQVKNCEYYLDGNERDIKAVDQSIVYDSKQKKFKVQTDNNHNAILNTLLLRPEIELNLTATCALTSKTNQKYTHLIQEKLKIHRNKAQPGVPRFTLSTSSSTDHSTTAADQYADWGRNTRYYIGVTTDHFDTLMPFDTCDINGRTYTYSKYNNSLSQSIQLDSSDLHSSHADSKDGNYQRYGDSRDYKGTCNIGSNPDSDYHYYPVKDIPIQHGFTITRYGPRIAKRSDFSGQFGEISLDDKKDDKLRPGKTFTLTTSARLIGRPATGNGDFPDALAQTTTDSNLQSNQCLSGWKSNGSDGCRADLSTIDQQGNWRLQANSNLMETTTAMVHMTGSNREGIFSSNYTLADKQITITPLLSLEGKFSPEEGSLTDKVYHHGSRFTVPASYTLQGRTNGKLNNRYKGKLTALTVTLDNNLDADKAGTGTLEVAGQPDTKNKDWDGHTNKAFMTSGSSAALEHDQSSTLKIPLTVTRSSHDPARTFATIEALGSFAGDNVDVVKEPALQPGKFTIELGPDLYPAKEAYHMEINNSEPLAFSPGQKEPLTLKVNFNSRLTADKLATKEGIQATAMNITLPPGLQRAAKYPIQLFCNDGKACNSEVNNSWDGKQHSDILQDHFLLKPDGSYSLSVPVMVDHDISASPSPVTLTMSQNDKIIGQDTRARIVSKNSTTTENKRVEKIARGDIAILPLDAKDQTIIDGNKMNITVAVKNGQQSDSVTLQTGSSTIPLRFKDKQGDIARFTSEQPLPMPAEANYSLKAQLSTHNVLLAGPALGDPRQLSCTLENDTNLNCTFRWKAPLPYVSGAALLSYNALNNTDKQLTGNKKGGIMAMEPEEARQKLQESLQDLESNGTWTDIQSFSNKSTLPRFTRPHGNKPEEQSLFEAGKALPAKGTFEFN